MLGSKSLPLDALRTFLPGLGRWSVCQPDHHTSWVQPQPDWRRGGPVGGELCESAWDWKTYLRHETICFCTNGVLFIFRKCKSQIGSNLWCSDILCTRILRCSIYGIRYIHVSPASHAKVFTHSDQVSNVNTMCQILKSLPKHRTIESLILEKV